VCVCVRSTGIVLSTVIMLVCMLACRFSYLLLLYCTQLNSKRSYEDLTEQVRASKSVRMCVCACVCVCMCVCVCVCTAAANQGCAVADQATHLCVCVHSPSHHSLERCAITQAVGRHGRTLVYVCTAATNLGCIVAFLNILADVISSVAGTIIPPGAEPSRSTYLAGVKLFFL